MDNDVNFDTGRKMQIVASNYSNSIIGLELTTERIDRHYAGKQAKAALNNIIIYIIKAIEDERAIVFGEKSDAGQTNSYHFSSTDNAFMNLLNVLNGSVVISEEKNIIVQDLYNDIGKRVNEAHRLLREAREVFGSIENIETMAEREANIAHILPQPTPAPINVRLTDGRLTLISSQTLTGSLSLEAIERIREGIREMLENALIVLGTQHNADLRFAPSCQPLLRHLGNNMSEMSVESLGMNWQVVSQIVDDLRDGLPATVVRQVEQVLKSTNLLLSQYKEWRDYIGAEAIAGLTDTDLNKLFNEVVSVVDDIDASPAVVDPEIKDRFLEIITPPLSGLVRTESMSVPLVNSLSNYFSEIVRIILEEAPWVADVSSSVAQNKPAQNAALLFALAVLSKHYPEISKLPMFRFMSDGYEFAIKHFPWAKDTILK